MSQFARLKTKIVSLDYLKKALGDLNYTYEENKTITVWGRSQRVDMAVKVRGSWLGFQKRRDAYDLIGENTKVRGATVRAFVSQVMQRYAYHAARDKLEAQGFDLVSEDVEEGGRVHLVLRRMA